MDEKNLKEKNSENSPVKSQEIDAALRPPTFSDFTGQDKTLERLIVMVGAAVQREESLKHILLCGPPEIAILGVGGISL